MKSETMEMSINHEFLKRLVTPFNQHRHHLVVCSLTIVVFIFIKGSHSPEAVGTIPKASGLLIFLNM